VEESTSNSSSVARNSSPEQIWAVNTKQRSSVDHSASGSPSSPSSASPELAEINRNQLSTDPKCIDSTEYTGAAKYGVPANENRLKAMMEFDDGAMGLLPKQIEDKNVGDYFAKLLIVLLFRNLLLAMTLNAC
jgi:hypothetical protein